MRAIFFLMLISIFALDTAAQNFTNNDLNGIVGIASYPTSWQNVPFTDPNCLATAAGSDTPDVTDATGPDLTDGIAGVPYSGSTMVTGLKGSYGTNLIYHEGIMQSVTGFNPGCNYTIIFQQAVVKQTRGLDTSGSWGVFIDNALAGITLPSKSFLPFNNVNVVWEQRSITFTATAATHVIKFLPEDDDTNSSLTSYTLDAAVRMGIDSIYIVSSAPPTGFLGNDTVLCSGQSLLLDPGINGTYQWQDSSSDSTYTVTQAGIYWVNISTGCGVFQDTINVASDPGAINVDLGSDTTLCQGQTLTLDATTVGGTYQWQDNSADSTFTVTQPGTYWVVVSNDCGTSSDTVMVDFETPATPELGNDTLLCEGNSITLDAFAPNATYLWQDSTTGHSQVVTEQGIYWVEMNTVCGTLYDTIEITYKPLPSVTLHNDTTICIGEELTLDVTSSGDVTYLWQDNTTGPVYTVTEEGIYTVELTNECGTTSDDIAVELVDCSCPIYLPTAFSPNGDGTNDLYKLVYSCDLTSFQLRIFNRWGAKIFETTDPEQMWDGRYKGVQADIGVYVVIVKYRSTRMKAPVVQAQNVTLLR